MAEEAGLGMGREGEARWGAGESGTAGIGAGGVWTQVPE